MEKKAPQRIAIVGSGLAGLTAAHILHSASHSLTIFEQSPELSFDSASVSIGTPPSSSSNARPVERIDLPMRAVAGGYYENVVRMYAYLGIRLHPVRFLFVFARALGLGAPADDHKAADRAYFVHASNLHRMPPRPENRSVVLHAVEVLFLIVCHFWFTAACFLVPPTTKPAVARPLGDAEEDAGCAAERGYGEEKEEESLGEYVRRIWLPRRYVSHYLLPLMSSVATCSHSEMLDFPARDIVEYKRRSNGQQHYVVCGGVRRVQERLVQGITDVRLGARVMRVQPVEGGVGVRWRSSSSSSSSCAGGWDTTEWEACEEEEEVFDRVILAVSPDVAGRIFSHVRALAGRIPTRQVESAVLCRTGGGSARTVVVEEEKDENGARAPTRCAHHAPVGQAQVITFRTRFAGGESSTGAVHEMPSGVLVQTCPLQESGSKPGGLGLELKTARFTRTLRTVESQRAVQRMMMRRTTAKASSKTHGRRDEWTNGQDGVWLVGAWCWDGMVLLEGCVVSAMRAARDMGVEAPWIR